MSKNVRKVIKKKLDVVHCQICSEVFKVNNYKSKSPMELFSGKGRAIPKKQLPEHKCK